MSSVDRAMAKAAASLLPGLLPTPPRSTMAPCLIILPLPSSFASKPKPGSADSVDRWDAHKKGKKPGSPSSSSCGSSSPGRVSSCERWDSNKKITSSSSTSSSSRGSSISSQKWDYTKRPLTLSRASAADRWDIHKKPRSGQADEESRTGEQEKREIIDKQPQEDETTATVPAAPRMDPVFSGSSCFASPAPSMLPMPTFFRSRCPSMMPLPAH